MAFRRTGTVSVEGLCSRRGSLSCPDQAVSDCVPVLHVNAHLRPVMFDKHAKNNLSCCYCCC